MRAWNRGWGQWAGLGLLEPLCVDLVYGCLDCGGGSGVGGQWQSLQSPDLRVWLESILLLGEMTSRVQVLAGVLSISLPLQMGIPISWCWALGGHRTSQAGCRLT